MCVYPCVCLVSNPPLQSDSPLSGIKKGAASWLVLVVAGAFLHRGTGTWWGIFNWEFLHKDSVGPGQVMRGAGEKTLESIQDTQRTRTNPYYTKVIVKMQHRATWNIRGKKKKPCVISRFGQILAAVWIFYNKGFSVACRGFTWGCGTRRTTAWRWEAWSGQL